MAFVIPLLVTAVVVVAIVYIVQAVVQIIEMVIHLIMILLGWDSGSTQIIEYFEVHNIPLFDDPDRNNPLLNSILTSILQDKDIASNLIYHLVFRSLKGNVKEFMDFIDEGDYFESFPTIDSFILTIDYTELTAALNTLNGVPCTPEGSYLIALDDKTWAKYWLQENAGYNVGTNTIGVDHSTTSTSPATPAADTVTVTPSTNHFDIDITSETTSSDEIFADERWQVNLNTIVYNAVPDDYTVQVYNAPTVGSITRTLPYTVPTKPLLLHYVSYYYRDSAPSRQYIFIYKVGTGVYTDLDTIETPIDIDGAAIEALPAIPLRVSNSNYTTFGATKAQQIEDLLAIIHLNAEDVLDTILTESGTPGGDLDHIYITFGVRMWDTSQAGMSYLYNMFENLYPAQGVTQGTYNNTPTGDDKPHNNIVTETDDNKTVFQWAYITYEHTTLVDIDADSGSVENGIYYSDMSRFDADDILVNRYYVSSGKGTYNVGYKADDLDEVQDFLDGSGVPNPGITSGEATNWLQVTERLSYNNPTPNLLEADDSAADLKYLTPDLIYENNGSGVLRIIESALEPTTVGQSITYYCCKSSGLDAYTVVAPIAALRVVDGSSGHFRVVKFNLGNKGDLMVPFIHNFIRDLSNDKVSRLFLAGAHATIYVAHYEVIVHEGMSFLMALVLIIIIIVVAYYTYQFDGGQTTKALLTLVSTTATTVAVNAAINYLVTQLVNLVVKMVVQYVIELIIAELVDDPELRALLNLLAAVAVSMWDPGITVDTPGGNILNAENWQMNMSFKSFSALTPLDFAKIGLAAITGFNEILLIRTETLAEELSKDRVDFEQYKKEALTARERAGSGLFERGDTPLDVQTVLYAKYDRGTTFAGIGPGIYTLCNAQSALLYEMPNQISQKYEQDCSVDYLYTYV